MRNPLSVLGLALALGACSTSAPDPRGVARDEVLVQVSASGRAATRPDEARFTVGVETIAATSGAASTQNTATINKVAAALQRLGVREDDLQTRSITLSRIDYGPNRGRFQANNLIEIKVRDIKRAGEAPAAITEAAFARSIPAMAPTGSLPPASRARKAMRFSPSSPIGGSAFCLLMVRNTPPMQS